MCVHSFRRNVWQRELNITFRLIACEMKYYVHLFGIVFSCFHLHHERSFPHCPSPTRVFVRLFVFFFFEHFIFHLLKIRCCWRWCYFIKIVLEPFNWKIVINLIQNTVLPNSRKLTFRTIAPEHWLFSVCMALLLGKKLPPIPNVYNKTSNSSIYSVLFIRSSTNRQICKCEDWACARGLAPQYSRY